MKNNAQLQSDVQSELAWEPKLHDAQLGVKVKDGIVTLFGNVHSFAEKIAAEAAAQRVYGVRGIAEDIEVKLPDAFSKSDTEIAEAALKSLQWSATVPDENIKIKVDNGWITLSGKVNWKFQSDDACNAVQSLSGVKGVINKIEIKPVISVLDIKHKIEKALERNAILEAKHVKVETDGSKVILKGHLDSWAEYKEAEHAAWSAPGVTSVDNRIIVYESDYIES